MAQYPTPSGLAADSALKRAELVIFDFDGVVADSEVLSLSTLQRSLSAFGIPLSLEKVREGFLGKSLRSILRYVRDHSPSRSADGFAEHWQHKLFASFREELAPVAGIECVLDQLALNNTPYCIASSGSFERIGVALEAMGLSHRFSHIFSAEQVSIGKPAPDLFLLAAQDMNVAPELCLVIEDSPFGVQAAKSAKIPCIGFLGGSHLADVAERHRAELMMHGANLVVASHRALLTAGPTRDQSLV
jgi:HAD superfamily hydrolase (TIGR01509 family)